MIHFEKESLGLFPTPMYRLPNISKELGTNIWIKRDDLCGVALGGNKVRKLEYLLHDAKEQGYDLVMTTGQAQSNHAMLTAACALRMGMDCILVLKKRGVTARKGNQSVNATPNVRIAPLEVSVMWVIVRFKSAITSAGRNAAASPSREIIGRCSTPSREMTEIMNGKMANTR